MRPRFTVLAALATGIGLGLAGCGHQPAVTSHARQEGLATVSASQADPASAWAEGYCAASGGLVRTLATLPSVNPSTPQLATQTSGELMASVVEGLNRTSSALGKLGPSPVAGGDASRNAAIAQLNGIRARADDVRRRLDSSTDPEAAKTALRDARTTLDELDRLDLLRGLNDVPQLAAAASRIPGCQDLVKRPR
ncbi:hypothetical protein [Amycolatopsis regifaucium]|uniref:Uncharacterized protein n=1 Tax=Amycolatopsis regifaucium TaxID=546365 RepID=A0A154MIL4_9PSEU|nr:hypothetical protein [Amycolatopsis regifaucium]KZB83309.1 hypothetical protein AVL48_03935 [Amycolatopsis regifaucium]OKA08775.1 hypothetical protein ATP06_0210400 [Amycolatopsis regifaucium]SFI95428.1 hypothetical protein SAMN04489731_114136 [Amycolatopsis regifaucium]